MSETLMHIDYVVYDLDDHRVLARFDCDEVTQREEYLANTVKWGLNCTILRATYHTLP